MYQIPSFSSPVKLNQNDGMSTPENNIQDNLEYSRTGVTLMVDVKDFAPHEIIIKVSKRLLEVTAENDRRGRCGLFRKYFMPLDLEAKQCFTQINGDGILCVAVPWEGNQEIYF